MKIGRNDPCPCGSGKKYKQCCLRRQDAGLERPADLNWRRLQRFFPDFKRDMVRFIEAIYGAEAFDEAWHEFMLWDESETEFDMDSLHLPVFMPWFFHRWTPETEQTCVKDIALHGKAPAATYLDRKARRLDPTLHAYLQSCLESPFGFYEVLRADPGQGLRLWDLITGAECSVVEHSASQTMQAGDVLYGQLGEAGGTFLLEACSPVVIPPIEKTPVIELRRKMGEPRTSSSGDLRVDWEFELRELYLSLTARLLYPDLPQLANTDGDPLSFQRLVFDIDSPQAAFDALKHLALDNDTTEEDLLEEAEFDAEGNLRRVDFPWKREGRHGQLGFDNTVLASIEIDGRRLTAEVNSEERARAARNVIETSLGDKARYRATQIQSVEKLLEDNLPTGRSEPDPEHERLNALPEVQAKLNEMLARHYEDWVNETIPALGNRTPMEAVKDADGREMVEALLRQFERDSGRGAAPMNENILRRLRERLGLAALPDGLYPDNH